MSDTTPINAVSDDHPTFEVFKGRRHRSRPSDGPAITFHHGGTIGLNRAAFDALGRPEQVDLSWDRDANLVRVRQTEPDTDTAHRTYSNADSGGALVSCRPFLRWCGLLGSVTMRCRAEVGHGGLVADVAGRETGSDE